MAFIGTAAAVCPTELVKPKLEEKSPELPEVELNIESSDIVAKTRKLKAIWTYEARQDLRSVYSFDAEKDLTDLLTKEMIREIDIEVLGRIAA